MREPRVAVITGASSGIGKATAEWFAEAGWHVYGTSRTQLPDPPGITMLCLDVRSDDSVAECLAGVLERSGKIDVLVNNAGVMHNGVAEETTLEEARALFETNLFGVARMTNAVLPHMRSRRRGRIINVGSAAARVGEPGEAFYSASKHALAGFTEALRHEVWPLGIHVSLIEPGAFATRMLASRSTNDCQLSDYDAVRDASLRTFQRSLSRGGDPTKVARLILKVAQARTPRLRYPVGSEARWLPYLRVVLPQWLFDRLLRKGFGLRRTSSTEHAA